MHKPDGAFTPWGKLAYAAAYALKGGGATLLIGFVLAIISRQSPMRSGVRVATVTAGSGVVAALVAAFQPTPMHRDYLAMAVPWLAILTACLIDPRRVQRYPHLRNALVALVAMSFAMGVGWSLRHVRHLLQPSRCAPFEVHHVGRMLAIALREQSANDSLVATLAPVVPLEARLRIYPELATGPFLFRVADLLTEHERARYVGTSPRMLGELLSQRPPQVILIGFEDELEQPLIDFARAHRYQWLPFPGSGLRVYVRPPVADASRWPAPPAQARHWRMHVIDDRWRGADGVKLGNVNGDGLPDMVVPWEESGVVVVYMHPGMPAVGRAWPSVLVGRVKDPEDAVLVDLDGDGALDVVSCCQGGTRTVFVHWAPHEPSQFSDPQAWHLEAIPVTAGLQQWMFCEAAQIDGMHGVDLVIAGKGVNGQIGYLAAPENPRRLRSWTWHPLTDVSWTMSIIPVDLNRDGSIDIVYSDRKGAGRGVYWLQNPGAALAVPWRRHVIARPENEVMFLDLVPRASSFEAVAATAGRTLLRLVPSGRVELPWTATPIDLPQDFGTGKGVRMGDLNGDGLIDVVFSCENADGHFGVGWLHRQEAGETTLYSPRAIGEK